MDWGFYTIPKTSTSARVPPLDIRDGNLLKNAQIFARRCSACNDFHAKTSYCFQKRGLRDMARDKDRRKKGERRRKS